MTDAPITSRYAEACEAEAKRWDRIHKNHGGAYAKRVADRWREKAREAKGGAS